MKCISRVRDASLRQDLESIASAIEIAASDYDRRAAAVELHLIQATSSVDGIVSNTEMKKIYTNRFAKEDSPGRDLYLRIRNAAPHDRCPICSLNSVRTLDHHLPKSRYSNLTVTPNNLVPSCDFCQAAKSANGPTSRETQTFHPYFDDFDSVTWLQATVVQGDPVAFRFFVEGPEDWPASDAARAREHFRVFELYRQMATLAAEEFGEIRNRLVQIFQRGGVTEVRALLLEEESTRGTPSPNTWKAAFYRACAASDWLCACRFLHVGD